AFARGDRRLARVLEQAWRDGAKFDGWSDLFRSDIWHAAFEKCGIDIRAYSERTRAFDEPLPWEVTSPGANKEFFLREWQKAMQGALTEDCRRGKCSACGICPNLGVHVIDYKKQEEARGPLEEKYVPQPIHPEKMDGAQPPVYWYRARVTKDAAVRFVSHLEYADVFVKAFDRAKLPMAYSSGFNPHMKLAFGSALAVGVSSEAEYMDFALTKPLAQPEVFDRLSAQLPPGVRVLALRPISGKHVALMAQADAAHYRVSVPLKGGDKAAAKAQQAFDAFAAAPEVFVTRVTPKKTRKKEIKQYLGGPLQAAIADDVLTLMLTTRILRDAGSVKPGEILAVLADEFGLPVAVSEADIHRTALTGRGRDLIDLVG
ncbi:MAG: TIGR03936 family radical SAM-associated protein, partial [Selenomonas bovis]